MTLRKELLEAIQIHPQRDVRPYWHYDTVGKTVIELLEKTPRLADKISLDELSEAMRMIADRKLEHFTDRVQIVGSGGDNLYVGSREIRYQTNTWYLSADMPGLFAPGKIPPQPEAHAQAASQVNKLLDEMGIPPQVVAAEGFQARYAQDFETTQLTIKTPERSGVYEQMGMYAHCPAEERLARSQSIAKTIANRIANKESVEQARVAVEFDIGQRIANVEGMRLLGSKYEINIWTRRMGGSSFQGSAYAIVEVIGDTLQPKTINVAVREGNEDSHLKNQISKHRANYKKLAGRTVGEALQCEPILAAAIRAQPVKYAKDLLKEIEAAIKGLNTQPKNPRLRGIANLSFNRGVLSSPVTMGKGVRFMNERVNVTSISQLPEALMQSLPGRMLREVVDHPYLDGLKIKSVTINTRGLHIRPEPAPVPLEDVLRDLRNIIVRDAA